jgi:alpha-N-arabinofuranosidase
MNKMVINADLGKHTINRHIYGHFSEHLGRCIYGGYWVGEDSDIPNTRGIRNDVVEALKAIKIPNLRWPGGCFADEYHWMDGIGPRKDRPTMVNSHWGGVTENNHFGTHEFFDLCEQLECEPYICGNVGSGSPQEMSQWVEYITMDGKSPMADLRRKNGRKDPWPIKFWGIGNESWGCGGHMRPEFYADRYRQFMTYCRNYGDNKLFKIACGPHTTYYEWTDVLMREISPLSMQGLTLHYYCGSGKNSRHATEFEEEDWHHQLKSALFIEELLTRHATVMDRHDPEQKVQLIVDEWGAWHDVAKGSNPGFLYMQNSLRDALVAGVSLNCFHEHCDRVGMANIAQTVNVLQALILTEGARMLLTPTYHVFDMYKVHQGATLLPLDLKCDDYEFGEEAIPQVSASASLSENGTINISLCNLNPNKNARIKCDIRGADVSTVSGTVLTDKLITAHNTFDKPNAVKTRAFKGGKLEDNLLTFTLPSKSVVTLTLS